MSFPVVQATNTSANTSVVTSHTVSLPAGIVSGDLLLILFGLQTAGTITTPTGWTALFNILWDSSDKRLAAFYRTADGTEGSSVSITTSSTSKSAHNSYRISGQSRAPEATTAIMTDHPNPPSLSPAGGSKKILWLAVGTYRAGTTVSTYPTNYTNGIDVQTGATFSGDTGVASARRSLEAASEDPSAFTLAAASTACAAATIAIKPLSILTANTGTFTLTGLAAGLIAQRKLITDMGSFTLTGQAAILLASRKLVAETGAFVLAGSATLFARIFTCLSGQFSLTGRTVDLIHLKKRTKLLPLDIRGKLRNNIFIRPWRIGW
jgi:hypothetical protein